MEDTDKGGKPKPPPDAPDPVQKKPRKSKLEKEGFKPDPDVEAGHQ